MRHEQLQPFAAGARGEDLETVLLQHVTHRVANRFLTSTIRMSCPPPRRVWLAVDTGAAAAAPAVSAGRCTLKIVPRPGSLSTVTKPPWPLTIPSTVQSRGRCPCPFPSW